MSVIVDANCAPSVFSRDPASVFKPVFDAIHNGSVKLVFGGRKLKCEYKKMTAVWTYIKKLDQAGKARLVSDTTVDTEQSHLEANFALTSNDPHILALARVSSARLLCSHDRALHTDFTNPKIICKPRGSIYQNLSHAHLIKKCCLQKQG